MLHFVTYAGLSGGVQVGGFLGSKPLVDEDAAGHGHVKGFGRGPIGGTGDGDGRVEAVEDGGAQSMRFASEDKCRGAVRRPGVGADAL